MTGDLKLMLVNAGAGGILLGELETGRYHMFKFDLDDPHCLSDATIPILTMTIDDDGVLTTWRPDDLTEDTNRWLPSNSQTKGQDVTVTTSSTLDMIIKDLLSARLNLDDERKKLEEAKATARGAEVLLDQKTKNVLEAVQFEPCETIRVFRVGDRTVRVRFVGGQSGVEKVVEVGDGLGLGDQEDPPPRFLRTSIEKSLSDEWVGFVEESADLSGPWYRVTVEPELDGGPPKVTMEPIPDPTVTTNRLRKIHGHPPVPGPVKSTTPFTTAESVSQSMENFRVATQNALKAAEKLKSVKPADKMKLIFTYGDHQQDLMELVEDTAYVIYQSYPGERLRNWCTDLDAYAVSIETGKDCETFKIDRSEYLDKIRLKKEREEEDASTRSSKARLFPRREEEVDDLEMLDDLENHSSHEMYTK